MGEHDPLVESRVLLLLGKKLSGKGGSIYYRVKGVGAPNFDTDMDILEIKNGVSTAYEVKGVTQRKRKQERILVGPRTLEGADQALIHLCYADFSYLVHPETMFMGYLARSKLLVEYLPIGYIICTSDGEFVELVPAKKSPIDVRKLFGHKRLIDVEPYNFATTDVWDIEKELERSLKRCEGLTLDYSEEDRKEVREILAKGRKLV